MSPCRASVARRPDRSPRSVQVLSWGTSTVGRIAQRLDFEKRALESTFDTIIFGLTVVPIVGWFKLLPTFGGRVVTEADDLRLEGDETVVGAVRCTAVADSAAYDVVEHQGLLWLWRGARGIISA